ncbi:MAG: DUF4162 domain-containing protein, partial [Putridiphycobacter sp.]|nr:DUF4162 domain-containing protein [Putridiphycobacter sp.]
VKFRGVMMAFANALWSNFILVDKVQIDENTAIAHVQLKDGNSVNDLLKAVIPAVEIISIQEILPSMNDIFINAVKQVKGGENE